MYRTSVHDIHYDLSKKTKYILCTVNSEISLKLNDDLWILANILNHKSGLGKKAPHRIIKDWKYKCSK